MKNKSKLHLFFLTITLSMSSFAYGMESHNMSGKKLSVAERAQMSGMDHTYLINELVVMGNYHAEGSHNMSGVMLRGSLANSSNTFSVRADIPVQLYQSHGSMKGQSDFAVKEASFRVAQILKLRDVDHSQHGAGGHSGGNFSKLGFYLDATVPVDGRDWADDFSIRPMLATDLYAGSFMMHPVVRYKYERIQGDLKQSVDFEWLFMTFVGNWALMLGPKAIVNLENVAADAGATSFGFYSDLTYVFNKKWQLMMEVNSIFLGEESNKETHLMSGIRYLF